MGKVIINVVLPTKTMMFCSCAIPYDEEGCRMETVYRNNSCPVCLKIKGAFLIPNKGAVEQAIAVVLALHGKINQYTLFDRVKSETGAYDIISQCSYPIGKEGFVGEPHIDIPVFRLKEDWGIPVLEIASGDIEEEQNPYYIEEIEKVLTALGIQEWEIIETDDVIETMENQNPISYLPDPDIPPVIISQWWINQIAAKYPDLIHIEEPEVDDEDDF